MLILTSHKLHISRHNTYRLRYRLPLVDVFISLLLLSLSSHSKRVIILLLSVHLISATSRNLYVCNYYLYNFAFYSIKDTPQKNDASLENILDSSEKEEHDLTPSLYLVQWLSTLWKIQLDNPIYLISDLLLVSLNQKTSTGYLFVAVSWKPTSKKYWGFKGPRFILLSHQKSSVTHRKRSCSRCSIIF